MQNDGYIDLTDESHDHLLLLQDLIEIKATINAPFIIFGSYPRDEYEKRTNTVEPSPDIDIALVKKNFDKTTLRGIQSKVKLLNEKIQITALHDDLLASMHRSYLKHTQFFIPYFSMEQMEANGLTEGHLYTVSEDCIKALKERKIVLTEEFIKYCSDELSRTELSDDFTNYFKTFPAYIKKQYHKQYVLSEDTQQFFHSIAEKLCHMKPKSYEQEMNLEYILHEMLVGMGLKTSYYKSLNSPLATKAAERFEAHYMVLKKIGFIAYEQA